jgi:two-component system, NtrC family, sensor kinase
MLSSPPRQHRILVIDDEPGLTQLLSRILRRSYTVVAEEDGRAALARLSAGESFDLVLCDVIMAPLTGFEVYEQVAKLAPELATRFVLMSGGAPNQELESLLNGWRYGLLRKPFAVDEVARLVASSLERAMPGPVRARGSSVPDDSRG